MNKDKELLRQLNILKSIKPDLEWKKENREVLFSQISSTDKRTGFVGFYRNIKITSEAVGGRFLEKVAQPNWTIAIIILLVFSGGSAASLNAARDSKPGDSLYIAKIVNEKTKFVLAFDEKRKAKLGLKFASNRAKEISQVLSEHENNEANKNEKVDKLTRDFKKEIAGVRDRLEKINIIAKDDGETVKEITEEEKIFSANLEKEQAGMKISTDGEDTEIISSEEVAVTEKKETATSTDDFSLDNKTSEDSLGDILDEAEKLFSEENYRETADKLYELELIIDQEGKTKGEDESATTTPQINNNDAEEGEVLGISEEADGNNTTTEN